VIATEKTLEIGVTPLANTNYHRQQYQSFRRIEPNHVFASILPTPLLRVHFLLLDLCRLQIIHKITWNVSTQPPRLPWFSSAQADRWRRTVLPCHVMTVVATANRPPQPLLRDNGYRRGPAQLSAL
jgi:hypothetical protein